MRKRVDKRAAQANTRVLRAMGGEERIILARSPQLIYVVVKYFENHSRHAQFTIIGYKSVRQVKDVHEKSNAFQERFLQYTW